MVFRRSVLVILPAIALTIGCSRQGGQSDRSASLPAIRPASGGELVLVPAGRFTMGDPRGADDEKPHEVQLDAFYIDRFPVTQEMYERVVGKNPSKWKTPKNPVEQLLWTDAVAFCNRCSELEGLAPCYDPRTFECDFNADGYRLPTEAEWEYACRAGSRTRYAFGDDPADFAAYGWCKPHSRGRPHPVGKKKPNEWGLHDMHGNVWQWCHDYYSETYYAQSPPSNPTGPPAGKQRVLRGGSWKSSADACRASSRQKEFPVFTDACFGADCYGFRRVRHARSTTAPARLNDGAAKEPPPAEELPVAKPDAPAADKNELPQPTGRIDPQRLTGTIVFVSDRSGSLDVWTTRPDGTQAKPLTNDAHVDADPRFSPDGRRILYRSLRDGFPEVRLMNRDGSESMRLTEGSQADWAPDGRSIVFVRDDQVCVRELETGVERRVTPAEWNRCGVPAWSPDGKQLAIASRHEAEIGVYLLDTDGSAPRRLQTEEACCTPAWSRDGKRLVFQTVTGHIHEFDLESGGEEQLTFGADIQHDARYSPDGSLLVFSRAPASEGPWQIWVLDLNSDDLDTIPITHDGSNRLPDWCAD